MLLVKFIKGSGLRMIFLFMCVIFSSLSLNTQSECSELSPYEKYVNQANKLKTQKKHIEAEKVLSLAISKYPYAAQLYFMRGKIRTCQEAIIDYSRVIELKSNIYQPKAYLLRGNCMYQFGLYQKAINDFTNCLRIYPKYGSRVYFLRAKAYAKLNMIENAMNDLKTVVKSNPEYNQKARELKYKIISGRKDF